MKGVINFELLIQKCFSKKTKCFAKKIATLKKEKRNIVESSKSTHPSNPSTPNLIKPNYLWNQHQNIPLASKIDPPSNNPYQILHPSFFKYCKSSLGNTLIRLTSAFRNVSLFFFQIDSVYRYNLYSSQPECSTLYTFGRDHFYQFDQLCIHASIRYARTQ